MRTPALPTVSVVTILKNRYTNFRHCVRLLHEVEEVAALEHVVVDFLSTDGNVPQLYTAGELAYQHLLVNGPFSLNRGRNWGIHHAKADLIFLCDADILVDPKLVHILRDTVTVGRMYFPIVRDLQQDCDTTKLWTEVLNPTRLGRWRTAGYGMCGFHKSDWERIGRFDEVRFTRWGGDDLDFFRRAQKQCQTIRHAKFGFYHQHHSRDSTFLNQYYQSHSNKLNQRA